MLKLLWELYDSIWIGLLKRMVHSRLVRQCLKFGGKLEQLETMPAPVHGTNSTFPAAAIVWRRKGLGCRVPL